MNWSAFLWMMLVLAGQRLLRRRRVRLHHRPSQPDRGVGKSQRPHVARLNKELSLSLAAAQLGITIASLSSARGRAGPGPHGWRM